MVPPLLQLCSLCRSLSMHRATLERHKLPTNIRYLRGQGNALVQPQLARWQHVNAALRITSIIVEYTVLNYLLKVASHNSYPQHTDPTTTHPHTQSTNRYYRAITSYIMSFIIYFNSDLTHSSYPTPSHTHSKHKQILLSHYLLHYVLYYIYF